MVRLIAILLFFSCTSMPDTGVSPGEGEVMVEEPVVRDSAVPVKVTDTVRERPRKLVLSHKVELPGELHESSGITRLPDGNLITHNDGGNDAAIYLLSSLGEKIRKIKVEDENHDWEDICSDTEGNLFISDLGNNTGTRKDLYILKIKKGFADEKKVNGKKIHIKFPYKEERGEKDKLVFDSEALFWMNGRVYIITKSRCEPYEGVARIFSVPDEPGDYEAREECKFNTCDRGWIPCSVTAADMNLSNNTLAALTNRKIYLFKVAEKDGLLSLEEGRTFSFKGNKQREAISWNLDSSFYITDEKHPLLGGGYLYRYDIK